MSTVSECDVAARQINSQRLADIVSYARKWIRQEERYEQLERDLEASQARLRGLKQQLERQNNNYERSLAIAVRAASENRPVCSGKGIAFVDAIDVFYKQAQIKPTTKRTYQGRLAHAQVHFGKDKDVRHIEQSDLAEYASHVKAVVPNAVTQGHYIRTAATFLNFLRAHKGWGAPLTTKTLLPKKETPDSDDRDSFTLQQLAVIFASARQYKEKSPCKYWATVAVAFTGCRIEELSQIHLETDLLQDKGSEVWYLSINGKPDPDGVQRRSLKNKASWRCVPIHSALVEHGFIAFLRDQHAAGFSRPFEANWKANIFDDGDAYKWSHYVTNWGGRELAKLRESGQIIDPENKLSYFHSMRHLVSQLMGRAKVPMELAEAALGHKYASGERERYNKLKFDPVQLSREAVEPGLMALAEML